MTGIVIAASGQFVQNLPQSILTDKWLCFFFFYSKLWRQQGGINNLC